MKYFFDINHQFNKLKREYRDRKQAFENSKEGVKKFAK
jgi:hypothetical protein